MEVSRLRKIVENLNLISSVIPEYSLARHRGLSDKKAEQLALEALSEAIEIIEEKLELFELREKYDKIREENS